VFVAVVGMVIAYYADIAPGGTVVLTAITLLIAVELGAFVYRSFGRHNRQIEITSHSHSHESHAHGTADDPRAD
jgi:hypothetical protein